MNRWMRTALSVALSSTHPRHKIGAVLVKGGAVVASACNLAERFKHAETRVLINRDGRDLSGSTLYVARLNGRVSKPCEHCMASAYDAGVKKVVFTGFSGTTETLKLRSA